MKNKKIVTGLLTMMIASSSVLTSTYASSNYTSYNQKMKEIANYSTGEKANSDGGVAEIVKYDKYNQKMYLVSGQSKAIHIVDLSNIDSSTHQTLKNDKKITMASLGIEDAGDITSVDIHPQGKEFAIAIQHIDYDKEGYIVRLNTDGKLISKTKAGVQPDMLTYTPNGQMILTANEGEPRNGYEQGAIDPQGTITALTLANQKSVNIDFSEYDSVEAREALVDKNVILKKNTNPSVDLEPEYIAVDSKSQKAYVSLQEANSIATIDLNSQTVISIDSLGFKDYHEGNNKIDLYKKEANISIANNEDFLGIYMPDGIATYEKNGKTYLLTANEGDSREWNNYLNEVENKYSESASKIVTLDKSDYDGLIDYDKNYLFGGRSFSIIDTTTMKMVSDSGADFEEITAKLLPEYFNCSNDDISFKDRSGKKGPEPEDVKTLIINNTPYAFIGLERIGGVMMYDISNPANPLYQDYINLRDFSDDIAGSVSPEGLCTISAKESPTDKPLLLVANEVSGDVNIIELAGETYNHDITLENASYTLSVGQSQPLNIKYSGYKTLTITSDNPNIVEVVGQVIEAKALGQATITITDGKITKTCLVTVEENQTDTNTPTNSNNQESSKQPTTTAPVMTGDHQNIINYIILLLGAVVSFVGLKKYSTKK